MSKLTIGIDYGLSRNDIPTYTVLKRVDGEIHLVDTGKLEDFDYTKYIATEHQIVGEPEDLSLFKECILSNIEDELDEYALTKQYKHDVIEVENGNSNAFEIKDVNELFDKLEGGV